jgi:hypothetical protein
LAASIAGLVFLPFELPHCLSASPRNANQDACPARPEETRILQFTQFYPNGAIPPKCKSREEKKGTKFDDLS